MGSLLDGRGRSHRRPPRSPGLSRFQSGPNSSPVLSSCASTTAPTDNRRRRARDVSELDGVRPLMLRAIPREAKPLQVVLLGRDRDVRRLPCEDDGPVQSLEERQENIVSRSFGVANRSAQACVGVVEPAHEGRKGHLFRRAACHLLCLLERRLCDRVWISSSANREKPLHVQGMRMRGLEPPRGSERSGGMWRNVAGAGV